MQNLLKLSVLLYSVFGLSACVVDELYTGDDYYSGDGYVRTYDTNMTSGYNRDYNRRPSNRGYYSKNQHTSHQSSNSGYHSDQTPPRRGQPQPDPDDNSGYHSDQSNASGGGYHSSGYSSGR